jgi:protein-L-isoaspartate(D-aspartate) O-methyltransferase
MRAQITRALIERRGFDNVALEADWPDAGRIDDWVRLRDDAPAHWVAFARFPTWRWRNRDMRTFVHWLRDHNRGVPPERRVAVRGLDIYSMATSIGAVLDYLDQIDPEAAAVARQRYGCLEPWQSDPAAYRRAALTGGYRSCEREVLSILTDLLAKRLQYGERDDERLLDAEQNARLVRSAEGYYRAIYYGGPQSWNLRDRHLADTLDRLLDRPDSKVVVWAHNSHVGDAAATEMAARGELNLGQLCRERFGADVHLVGFGTHSGSVAAARVWDGPMEVAEVRPAREGSHEHVCHESAVPRFVLPLRSGAGRDALGTARLERMIGVIYRPDTERLSHYLECVLSSQFDEWIWFDCTTAVVPLATHELAGVPETYPFGL